MKYLKSQGADGNPLAWIYHEDNTYGLYYFVLTDLGSLFCSGPFTIPLVTYMLVQIDIEWWEHETIICQIDVMTNVTLQKQQNRTTTPLTDRPRSAKKRSQSVSQSVPANKQEDRKPSHNSSNTATWHITTTEAVRGNLREYNNSYLFSSARPSRGDINEVMNQASQQPSQSDTNSTLCNAQRNRAAGSQQTNAS